MHCLTSFQTRFWPGVLEEIWTIFGRDIAKRRSWIFTVKNLSYFSRKSYKLPRDIPHVLCLEAWLFSLPVNKCEIMARCETRGIHRKLVMLFSAFRHTVVSTKFLQSSNPKNATIITWRPALLCPLCSSALPKCCVRHLKTT